MQLRYLSKETHQYFQNSFHGNHPLDVQLRDVSHTMPVKHATYNIRHMTDPKAAAAFEELLEFVTGQDIDVSSSCPSSYLQNK
jgi:hypothetical protein